MIPELFSFGPLSVHSFGLMMVLTFLSAWKRLELSLDQMGFDKSHAEPMVFYGAIGGMVGARLLYLIANFSLFLADPVGMLFTGAGFIFYGGFVGGFLSVVYYVKKNSLPFLQMADAVAPCLAIGYGVGRIGCQLSGDGDYGIETSLPWGMSYALGAVPSVEGVMHHPAPVYESAAGFLVAWVLVKFAPRLLVCPGRLFGLYLMMMSVERFLVEFIRREPVLGGGMTQAQWFAIGLSIAGALFFTFAQRKKTATNSATSTLLEA